MKSICFVLYSMNIGGTEKAWLNMVSDSEFQKTYRITLLLLEKSGGFLPYLPPEVEVITPDGLESFQSIVSQSPKSVIIRSLQHGQLLHAVRCLCAHLRFRRTQDRSAYWDLIFRSHPISVSGKYDIAVAYHGPDDFITYLTDRCICAEQKVQWIHFDVGKYLFHRRFAARYYPRFDRIYTVSEDAKKSLLRLLPCLQEKTEVYPNRLSPELCRQMAEVGEGFPDLRGFRILTVGRLSEEKGQDMIPQIARILKDKGMDFRWYLIGDGPLRAQVEQQNKRYGTEEQVILLGAMPNPYTMLRQASLYVQTSKHEGFGLAVAEAKIFRLPIVSTEVASIREQLRDYPAAITEHTPQALAQAIIKMSLKGNS